MKGKMILEKLNQSSRALANDEHRWRRCCHIINAGAHILLLIRVASFAFSSNYPRPLRIRRLITAAVTALMAFLVIVSLLIISSTASAAERARMPHRLYITAVAIIDCIAQHEFKRAWR